MESSDPLLAAVRRTWGYGALRPLQREAMEASLKDALKEFKGLFRAKGEVGKTEYEGSMSDEWDDKKGALA